VVCAVLVALKCRYCLSDLGARVADRSTPTSRAVRPSFGTGLARRLGI
jgi:hypothetical protein